MQRSQTFASCACNLRARQLWKSKSPPNNPFNPIAARTRLRVNGTLGREKRKKDRDPHEGRNESPASSSARAGCLSLLCIACTPQLRSRSLAPQCQPPRRASVPSVACRALHKLSPLHAARQLPASHSVPFVSVTASHEQSLPHAASHASAFRACRLHVRPSSHTKLATQQRVQPDRQQAVACWFPRRARRGGGLTQRYVFQKPCG